MARERRNPFQNFDFPRNYADLRRDPSDLVTQIKADESVSPFGPPPEYWGLRQEILNELRQQGNRSYGDVDSSPVVDFTRERYGLGGDVAVVPGLQGSNEMLERLAFSLNNNTAIRTFGPFFSDFLKSITYARRSSVQVISEPLDKTLEQILIDNKPKKGRNPSVILLTNPDVRGDFAEIDIVSDFVERWGKRDVKVVLDQSMIGYLPDNQSGAKLVTANSNLLVIESWSKAYGLADDGFATLIAHNDYAEAYREQMRHFHTRHRDYMMLFNKLAKHEIILPHLKKTREKVRKYKAILTEELDSLKIKCLPHDPRLPFVIVDGENEYFAREIDLPITPGSGYYHTYNHDALSTRTPMTDRYARVGLPVMNYDDPNINPEDEIKIIAKRIAGAIRIVKQSQSK